MSERSITIVVPEMTIEQYADHVGVTPRTVQNWLDRGYIPTVKVGKRRLVNVFQRTVECAVEGKDRCLA